MHNLDSWRRHAAELAAGTSDSIIKKLVLAILKKNEIFDGKLLDFGAGQGELLSMLSSNSQMEFDRLAGADLIPKPLSLGDTIDWFQFDLNDVSAEALDGQFDVVICSEVIEHLENPRNVFRLLSNITRTDGHLILTMPNQESLRSLLSLVFKRHFVAFYGASYPAHITALLEIDLIRLCRETGFANPIFYYTDYGAVPKLTRLSWQQLSYGMLKGRLFSDNLAMITLRLSA